MGRFLTSFPKILVVLLLAPLVCQIAFVVLPGFGSFVVLSGSMEPVIQTGSLVYVHESGDYEEGDIITFTVGEETVTHRIVGESPEGFVTKGETQSADSWRIEPRQIHGEYLWSIPLYGYLLRPLSPQGTGLWGVIAGVVVLSFAGRELLANVNGDAREESES